MGAAVIPVHSGSATLKDACNEALRDWSGSYEKAHYMLGTAAGPHPFPTIVREFQRMIGEETKAQILEKEGRLPDAVIACVGGGSNAIGMFADFIEETNVGLIGVEPAGHGIESGEHGAPLKHGRVGIYFGMKSPMMQTADGQIEESYSDVYKRQPFAALWGYLCLGETVEEGLILGALLVCVALWMIIVPSGRKRGVPDGA